ncbi:MAG: DUF4242 domain-containing protein [Chloroflexi bacterium]|nr:DUF4242 domain-containing protein [Chloroflexota bacterium]
MPLYMDLHKLEPGVSPKDLALAHFKDIEIQWKHGVKYLRYWFDQDTRNAFCLVDAPSVDAAVAVHREAHGIVADKIIPVAAVSVEEMLGAVEEVPPWMPDSREAPPAESAFRTIVFTDMEGSTALTQRLGDAAAMGPLRRHNAIIRECLAGHAGTEVKHTGDGIMASFASVARAVECAIAIQRAIATDNEKNPAAPIRLRIGLSAGEPVAENQDLFGSAVQLARRICDHAEPCQILVSNVIRELCIGKGFLFADRGKPALKGFAEPVSLHEVRWGDGNRD